MGASVEALEIIARLLFFVLLWAALASPFLVILFFVGRAMRRRAVNSPLALVSFIALATLLIAPLPTPIITVFYPSGYALMGGTLHLHFIGAKLYFPGLRPWIISSFIITFVVCGLAVLRFMATSAKGRQSIGCSGA